MTGVKSGVVILVLLACAADVKAQAVPTQVVGQSQDPLMLGFLDPPNGARPRVWWHWMGGNITPEGIKEDLDWMHRVGLGGVTIFEGSIATPQVVPHRVLFMTPEWKQLFNDAVTKAKGLGMEVAIASSPGWSETGGPWVPAAQGMKKMVWSATRVEGGRRFVGVLPHPPEVDGTFQNYKVVARRRADDSVAKNQPQFYADAAVIAYRIPDAEKTQAELNPKVTASGGTANVAALSDGDVNTVALELPTGQVGATAWVQFDYGHPQTIQAVTLATAGDTISVFDIDSEDAKDTPPCIEASDNGVSWHKIAEIRPSSSPERTVSFDAVTARYFRVAFIKPDPTRPKARKPIAHYNITELTLSNGARVNEFERRAGYANARDYFAITDPKFAPSLMVAQKDVIDLTGKMKADGTLEWTPPAGKWMVLRMGYSLTGHENSPAPVDSTGLEVDKLNRDYVKNYLEGYLKMYTDTVGAARMGKDGISYVLTDSIEAGPQNWTDNMLAEFKTRRGYDARPWLPTLTGVEIGSAADTDRFLWDFRRTIGELIAQNHYGEISDELHAHGMGYYGEALEFHRPSLGDDMEFRSRTDVPMGAMWTWDYDNWFAERTPDYMVDVLGAASVAHTNGTTLVGAEAMTSHNPNAYSYSPNKLKTVDDMAFALGVNRFEITDSSLQPSSELKPGLTLGHSGIWFNRNETWAEQAGPWVTYLARCSYLLQQGRFVGDVAYFYGEEGPLTAVFGWKAMQDAPVGYGFDFVNSDVVLHKLAVKDGRLVTPGGASYWILYLGGRSQRMTLAVLLQLKGLVEQGAVIVGNKPSDSPSHADNEAEFHAVVDELWGKGSAQAGSVHKVGKGQVFIGMTANDVLKALDDAEDFAYTKPEVDTQLMFSHRKLDDGDMYFVDNRLDRAQSVDATFRVEGKVPELWDAATGVSTAVSYRIANGKTTVPLQLEPNGTVFVMFRKKATAPSLDVPALRETRVAELDDALNRDWSVSFEPGRGAPQEVYFGNLTSWSDSATDGVKYFSGPGTYAKSIEVSGSAFVRGARLWLDLGDVENIAQVTVNGKDLGIVWKAPFRVDVTDALKPGSNHIAIQVTNLWVNRLIGDQQPNVAKKYTYTDIQPYDAKSPLFPSGLLGPLHISSVARQ